MKKQTVSRAAAILSASALTLGLTATAAAAAAADTAPPRPASSTASGTGGGAFDSGVGVDRVKNRKIDRLRKALARARAERADAYDTARAARASLSDADLIAHDSKVVVLAATEAEHQAKAHLTEARTRLNALRALLKDVSDLDAQNHDGQVAAAAAITAAENARDTATATAADLTAGMDALVAAHDDAAQAVVDAETEIAWLTNTTIPQATTNATTTQMQANALGTQTSDALAVYTNQTYAYNGGCFPQSDGLVHCLDNTGVWAVRGEVTDMWGTYLNLRAQWEAAQVVADDAAAALTAAQADLTQWNTERTNQIAAATTAQEAIDTAEADLAAAEATVVAATEAITEQQDVLATLAAAAPALAERLVAVQAEEKSANAIEVKHAATLVGVTTTLNEATTVHEANLGSEARAQQTLNQSYRTLAAAQDRARRIKDRLLKARAQNR